MIKISGEYQVVEGKLTKENTFRFPEGSILLEINGVWVTYLVKKHI